MGLLRHLGIASVAISTLLAGCSSTGLMDSNDDMSGSSSGGGSTGGVACSACFDTNCAWEVTECAADPECAQWLTCVKSAPSDGYGHVDGSWLADNCDELSGSTAGSLAAALSSCLTSSACCDGASLGADTGTGGTIAPGASGGNGGSAGGYNGAGGDEVGGAGMDGAGGWTCPEQNCTCKQCLVGLSASECAASVEACTKTSCKTFLEGYDNCVTEVSSNTSASTYSRRALEACLYEKASNSDGFQEFMATVYPCVIGECRSYCVPATDRACVQCQDQSCGEELDAFASSPDAVLGSWCRSHCQEHPEETSCPEQCSASLEAGKDVLLLYGQCVQDACLDACY